ncbi:TPA: TetR/AcrR family transcriptional regulator [Pseudomonas aeruginosa]|uniref:TetR/AcrR family transcriptional regulator n=1 Tax=Pseudomonadaceae TaxID=135621 RepID=UPI0009A320F3|nr:MULTISPECIES: TetR/AcrR family transcriptional regulator [Pseudomonas]MCO7554367.1 TetR/AcrR family transcriptional regulator [Pseudomonas otitidis]
MSSTEQVGNEGKRKRPGGRSAGVVSAVYTATMEILHEGGYERLELPEVAARAGVNKTTVYRRWPTKAELVLDISLLRMEQDVPVPDTGTLHGDLSSLLISVHAAIASPLIAGLIQAAITQNRDKEMIKRMRAEFWATRFAVSGQLVERAVERGELPPGTSSRQFLEFASSPLFFRGVITGEVLSQAEITEIARRTILAFSSP